MIPSVLALVDSGADGSLFPLTMMTPLGIDIGDCTEIDGDAASGDCTYHHWPHGHITTEVMGRNIKLMAMFGATQRVLLGRTDFFRVFKVSVDERKQRFRLDAY